MSRLFHSILFFYLVVRSFAQIAQLGSCPTVQPVQNFQPQNFTGIWYEIRRYDNFYDLNQRCNRLNITLESRNRLRIVNRGVDNLSRQVEDRTIIATPINRAVPQYRVRLPGSSTQNILTILDTDYTSFAIFYICQDLAGSRSVYLWLLSRQKTLGLNTLGRRLRVESANDLPIGRLRTVSQLNCPA